MINENPIEAQMTSDTIPTAGVKSTVQDLLEASELRTFSYSGRGMYGEHCLAVTLDTGGPLDLAAQLLEAARDLLTGGTEAAVGTLDDLIEALQDARTDSMGRGTVVYFPGLRFVPDGDEDLDTDRDDEP